MRDNHPSAEEKTKKCIEILLDQIHKNPPNQIELAIDPDSFYRAIPTLTKKELLKILKELTLQGLIEKVSIPTLPLQIEPNVEPEIHRTICVVPRPLQLLAYLGSMKKFSSYVGWERSGTDKRKLTEDEIMKKIQDFTENFPMYNELPEKHYMYEARFKEFITRLQKQISLSDEIRNHALAVFNPSYTCPGYPGYNKLFDSNTNKYGQRYMGIRFFVLPLLKKHVEEYFKERTRKINSASQTYQEAKKTVTINGVTIFFDNSHKVKHPKLGTQTFRSGKTPWKILRMCASKEPDGVGVASLEALDISESDIYKKLDLINQHFGEPIVHYRDGLVHLDPDFKK